MSISVKNESLRRCESEYKKLSQKLSQIENSLQTLRKSLDSDIKNERNIDRDFKNVCDDVDQNERSLSTIAKFLSEAIKAYESAEKNIEKDSNKLSQKKSGTNIFSGIFDKINSIRKKAEAILKILIGFGIFGAPIGTVIVLNEIKKYFDGKGVTVNNKEEKPIEIKKADIPELNGILSYEPGKYKEEVLLLQKRLNELKITDDLGRALEEDGKFGKNTLAALNKYKEEYGLWNYGEYEGKVGNTTWLHLFTNEKVPYKGDGKVIDEANGIGNTNVIGAQTWSKPIDSDVVDAYHDDIDTAIENIKTSFGDKGNTSEFEDALYIQMYLWTLGYDLGSSGPAGIGVDGSIGTKTKAALEKAVPGEITDLKQAREILKVKVEPVLVKRAQTWQEIVRSSGSLLDKTKYPLVDPMFYVFFQKQHQNGIDPIFAGRLAAFAKGNNISVFVGSGYRSYEEQVNSWISNGGWQNSDGTWGWPAGKKKSVATPGSSWHNCGEAIDISWSGEPSSKFFRNLYGDWASTEKQIELTKYGIFKPLTTGNKISSSSLPEEWHIQPIETKGITAVNERKSFYEACKGITAFSEIGVTTVNANGNNNETNTNQDSVKQDINVFVNENLYKDNKLYKQEVDVISKINSIDTDKFNWDINNFKKIYEKNSTIYKEISEKTGIPPELVAALHYRESGCNFSTYMHNGDPLGKPTTHVPKGKNFDNFADSAIDALLEKKNIREKYCLSSDSKDIAAMMAFAESYNGLGYNKKGLVSPYVFSGTNVYEKGKYVADGVFDSNAIDGQPGVYILINMPYAVVGN